VLLQTSVTLFVLQALPHPPQLLGVVMSVSQPSAAPFLQSAWAESHVMTQTELTQVPFPPAWLQTLPHAPQLFASLVVLISHPSPTLLLQSA